MIIEESCKCKERMMTGKRMKHKKIIRTRTRYRLEMHNVKKHVQLPVRHTARASKRDQGWVMTDRVSDASLIAVGRFS